MTKDAFVWSSPIGLPSFKFQCAHCSSPVASNSGFIAKNDYKGLTRHVYICHHCLCPSYFDEKGIQHPAPAFGGDVNGITEQETITLYKEARNCVKVNAYTASVMCSRKLLMHVAVGLGAPEGKNFVSYVEFLSTNNHIPQSAAGWVDYIRKKGNEANHEIAVMTKDDAERLITFVEMLLKIVYEFPASIPATTP